MSYQPLASEVMATHYTTKLLEEPEKETLLLVLLKLGFNVTQLYLSDGLQKLKVLSYVPNDYSYSEMQAASIFEPIAYVLKKNFEIQIESVQLVPELEPFCLASSSDNHGGTEKSQIQLEIGLKDDRIPATNCYYTKFGLANLEELLTSEEPEERKIGFLIKTLKLEEKLELPVPKELSL